MGLTIELSFDIDKNKNITQIKELLSTAAQKYYSNSDYFIHEIEGYGSIIDHNSCIHIVEFDINPIDEMKIYILKFLNYIIGLNPLIKVDCIHLENGKSKIIYASKKYLNITANNSINYKPHSNNILKSVSHTLNTSFSPLSNL
jgi:hypothetical protein